MNKRTRTYSIIRSILLGLTVTGIAAYLTWSLFHVEEKKVDALRRIRERGFLLAATDSNTLNYFIYRGEPMGYQMEMLQSFADYLGVPLRIIASPDVPYLVNQLDSGYADILALNLPVTSDGKSLVHFSNPFTETRLVLVQRISGKGVRQPVRSLKNFPADTVYVRQNPFLKNLYHAFYRNTGRKAIMKEVTDASQEELIRRVANGSIRFALCQENVAEVYRRNFSQIDCSVQAFPIFSCAWAVDRISDSLRTEVDTWLATIRKSGDLQQIQREYYENPRISGFLRSEYFSVSNNKLSPFDEAIRQNSDIVGWDWRLIASLIYEESNFITGLVSSRNASGLMQLMPATAAKFGIDSLSSPAQQIAGGIKYLKYLDNLLPAEIADPGERICFVLASYNVGPARVLSAREKARQSGRNINRWNGHVDYFLLNRPKKNQAAMNRGDGASPEGYRMEGFVADILTRYHHYRNLIR